MVDKKKQHYVPQLLLRYFSTDIEKKFINIFNTETQFYKKKCPLKNQAKGHYFYGNDGKVEEELSKIEDVSAPVIKNIITSKTLPKRGSQQHKILFLFTILLNYRTKDVVQKFREMSESWISEMEKYDRQSNFKEIRENVAKINMAATALSLIQKEVFHAYDLELKMIVNASSLKFIISDHPVVRYNQYLKDKKHPGGHSGMLTKGLQIFFPISPECLLVLYDKAVYKIGNKKDYVITVNNVNDINQLNYLQIVYCTQMIYSNDSINDSYLKKIVNEAKIHREEKLTTLYEINKSIDREGREHILTRVAI